MTAPRARSTCPSCKKAAAPRTENTAFPFCSARCKTIDLGKWLSEEYRVPVGGLEDPGDEGSRDEGRGDPELARFDGQEDQELS